MAEKEKKSIELTLNGNVRWHTILHNANIIKDDNDGSSPYCHLATVNFPALHLTIFYANFP